MFEYYFAPSVAFDAGKNLSYVVDRRTGDVIEVGPLAAHLINAGRGMAAVPDDDQPVDVRKADDRSAVKAALDRLAAAGLVHSRVQTTSPDESRHGNAAVAISTVAVLASGDPQRLKRSLQSLTSLYQQREHQPDVLVLDGSLNPVSLDHNRASALTLLSEWKGNVDYVGPQEAGHLITVLVPSFRSPLQVVTRHLSPASSAGRRNLALLLTAGENVFVLPDDIVPTAWTPNIQSGAALAGHHDPREAAFFESVDAAIAALPTASGDLVDAHERVLGHSLVNFTTVNTQIDFPEVCQHLVAGVAGLGEYTVRMSASSLAGFWRVSCPYRHVLLSSGPLRQLLASDETAFRLAVGSQAAHRFVRRHTLSHGPAGMTGYLGIANTQIIPPMMVGNDADDTLWAALLGFVDSSALFAHVPCGAIRQRSIGVERPQDAPSSSTSTVSDIFMWILDRVSRSCFVTGDTARLSRLGTFLEDITALDCKQFSTLLIEAILEIRCREMKQIELSIDSDATHPPYWVAAFEEYRRLQRVHIPRRQFYVPRDLKAEESIDGFSDVRRELNAYGLLLSYWADLWFTAKARRDQLRGTAPSARPRIS